MRTRTSDSRHERNRTRPGSRPRGHRSDGGYIFYNVTYLEAVELYFAAVAAAPAGYTPPPVTSISVSTTVSGTVEEPGR